LTKTDQLVCKLRSTPRRRRKAGSDGARDHKTGGWRAGRGGASSESSNCEGCQARRGPANAARTSRPRADRRSVNARARLLDAALAVIRKQGYAASTVDDLCAAAGVTKGAFFHHFESKEALAVAAADHWSETTGVLFASADYHAKDDPLERVLAYIDYRKTLIDGAIGDFTCLVGTMVQESYETSAHIRDACRRSIEGHAKTLEADLAEAAAAHGVRMPRGKFDARSLALFTQAAIQGGFILAKSSGDPKAARESIDHLRRYVELLFGRH
jgi:TetR/AcrR family transcriptional repressor of nem operon